MENQLDKIISYTCAVSKGEKRWQGFCPAHSDNTASLSISLDDKSNIGIKCHAGCDSKSVLNAMRLKWSDLFSNNNKEVILESKKRIVKTYDYTDYEGTLKYQVVRFEPKGFAQRRPDPEKEWIWSLGKECKDFYLYNIQSVKKQIDLGGYIILVEGEKDADRLNNLGFTATTTVAGAKSHFNKSMIEKWEQYSNQLKNANVIIIPDNDPVGLSFAMKVKDIISEKTNSVNILKLDDLNEKQDISDWLDKGHNGDDLMKLIENIENHCEPEASPFIEISDKGFKKVNIEKCAKYIIGQFKGNLIYKYEKFHVYTEGYWQPRQDRFMLSHIINILGELTKKSLVQDIFFHIESILAEENYSVRFNVNKNMLNMNNGVINMDTNEFIEHDRNYFFNLKLPVDFNGDSDCDRWLEFLDELEFDQETKDRLQEWAGYVLHPAMPIQKCLYLKGDGANGKSVFLETLSKVWGNVSKMEMSEMFDTFKIGYLEGKLANICTDADTTTILDARFKKIIAGEEVMAEKKYKDSYQFTPFAKIIFSANDYMPTKDRSHGFFRRFDVIEFSKTFTENEQDPHLMKKLLDEREGIFLWCYAGLMRLKDQNWRFTKSDRFEKDTNDFIDNLQPLKEFLSDECEFDPSEYVEKDKFRSRYKEWCLQNGHISMSTTKMTQELKRHGILSERIQTNGNRKKIYRGISISDKIIRISF